MVETLSNLFLALKAAIEHRIFFKLRVGYFEHRRLAIKLICRLEDRRHPAARQHLGQAILVEPFADGKLTHVSCLRPYRASNARLIRRLEAAHIALIPRQGILMNPRQTSREVVDAIL